jgi:hypothetical protein
MILDEGPVLIDKVKKGIESLDKLSAGFKWQII